MTSTPTRSRWPRCNPADLPEVRPDERAATLRLLSNRRDELVAPAPRRSAGCSVSC